MAKRAIETDWKSTNEDEYIEACERVRHEMELLTAAANAVKEGFAQVNECMERYIDLSGQLVQRSAGRIVYRREPVRATEGLSDEPVLTQPEPKTQGTPFRKGDAVTHPDMGDGVVVGFSSVTSAPNVYFYSQQEPVIVAADTLKKC